MLRDSPSGAGGCVATITWFALYDFAEGKGRHATIKKTHMHDGRAAAAPLALDWVTMFSYRYQGKHMNLLELEHC